MVFRKFLLAVASILCLGSLAPAQDLVLNQLQIDELAASVGHSSPKPTVSNLPADVFGEPTVSYAAESGEDIQQANLLVLTTIASVFIASLSALGLFLSLKKRARRQPARPMQVIGI